MSVFFEWFSMALFTATLMIFAMRLMRGGSRLSIRPYAVIVSVAFLSRWLGMHETGVMTLLMLVAGTFLLLEVVSEQTKIFGARRLSLG
ncbi:MAG: XrtV sorting system accessory protein [Pseudomonadota bacterium]